MTEIVALAGDWHGNIRWAQAFIREVGQFSINRIYHMGDFGIWPGESGENYLDHLNKTAAFFDIEIWVTPGNHEDYSQINEVPVGEDGLQWIRSNIALVPRGHRWEHDDRTFVSLGGAPSIDFEMRTEGIDWWRDEMITLEEAEKVAANGHADIMLAHDAPNDSTDTVQAIIDTPADKSGWSRAGLAYAAEGRELTNIAVAGVKPKLYVHGHYHVADDTGPVDGTRYLALNADGSTYNFALLRLSDLAISWDGKNWR